MWVFVAVVVSFVTLGEVKGNVALTEAMRRSARAPASLVALVQAMEQPVGDTLVSMLGQGVVPGARRVNATVHNATSVTAAAAAGACVVEGLRRPPLNVGLTLGVLDSVDAALGGLLESVGAFEAAVAVIDANASAAVELVGAAQNATVAFEAARGVLRNESAAFRALSTSVDPVLASLQDVGTGVGAVRASLLGGTALPNTTAAADAALALQRLLYDSPTAWNDGGVNSSAWLKRERLGGELLELEGEFLAAAASARGLGADVERTLGVLRVWVDVEVAGGAATTREALQALLRTAATLRGSLVGVDAAVESGVEVVRVRDALGAFNTSLITVEGGGGGGGVGRRACASE
jgi:hypothetical protein